MNELRRVRGNTALSLCLALKTTALIEDWECKPVRGPYVERRKTRLYVDYGY